MTAATTEARLLALIAQHWAEQNPGKPMPGIETATTWRDIEFDPIDLVCLHVMVEDEFEISLPMDAEDCESVGELAALIGLVCGEAVHG